MDEVRIVVGETPSILIEHGLAHTIVFGPLLGDQRVVVERLDPGTPEVVHLGTPTRARLDEKLPFPSHGQHDVGVLRKDTNARVFEHAPRYVVGPDAFPTIRWQFHAHDVGRNPHNGLAHVVQAPRFALAVTSVNHAHDEHFGDGARSRAPLGRDRRTTPACRNRDDGQFVAPLG